MKVLISRFITTAAWLLCIVIAGVFISQWRPKDTADMIIHFSIYAIIVNQVTMIPMIIFSMYRNKKFIIYCIINITIGIIPLTALLFGYVSVLVSLILSPSALMLENMVHSILFSTQQRGFMWILILILLHALTLILLGQPNIVLPYMNIHEWTALMASVPVTIWRFVCTIHRVGTN
jgi:hypothetical protein